jgi:hypothetical protein
VSQYSKTQNANRTFFDSLCHNLKPILSYCIYPISYKIAKGQTPEKGFALNEKKDITRFLML